MSTPAIGFSIPSSTVSAPFVNGEVAVSPGAGAASPTYLSKWFILDGGIYTIKLWGADIVTAYIGAEGTSIRRIATATSALVEAGLFTHPGKQRIDIALLTTITDTPYFVFSLWQGGKLVYASSAAGWVYSTTAIPDADVPYDGDVRKELPVWTVSPNWADSVTERLSWMTEVLPSETDSEQRRSLRIYPRRSVEASFLRKGVNAQRLDAFIAAIGRRSFMVPLWFEQLRIEGQAAVDTLSLFNFNGSRIVDQVSSNTAYGLNYTGQTWGTVYNGSPTLTLSSSSLGSNRAMATDTVGPSVLWYEKTPVHLMSGKKATPPTGIQVGTSSIYPVTEYPEQFGFGAGALPASSRGYDFDFDRELSADGFTIECSTWLSGRERGQASGDSFTYWDGAIAVMRNPTSGQYRVFLLYVYYYVENTSGTTTRETYVGLEVIDPHSNVSRLSEAQITASPGDLKKLCAQYNWTAGTMEVFVDGTRVANNSIAQTSGAGDTNPDPADLRFGYAALVTHIDEFNPSRTTEGPITHRPYWDNFRVSRILRHSGASYTPATGPLPID